jgi:glucokinase
VAGAIVDGRAHLTNLHWEVQRETLAGVLKSEVYLLNDMQATAYGMLSIKPGERFVLNAGTEPAPRGNVAVIAAGTGLGESCLCWDGLRYHPMASEGGHVDFSPRNDIEVDLWSYLRAKFSGHVSWERVLSGPGLFNVYSFLRDRGYYPEPPGFAERLTEAADPNPLIAQAGVARTNPLCAAAIDLFVDLYGAEAGNLALKCLAVGGVYLAGGIAPRFCLHNRFPPRAGLVNCCRASRSMCRSTRGLPCGGQRTMRGARGRRRAREHPLSIDRTCASV